MGQSLKDFNFSMGIQSFLFRHTPLGTSHYFNGDECPTWNGGRSGGSCGSGGGSSGRRNRSSGTFAFGQHDGSKPSLAENSNGLVGGANVRWPVDGIFHRLANAAHSPTTVATTSTTTIANNYKTATARQDIDSVDD
jgi:hypothetical protein